MMSVRKTFAILLLLLVAFSANVAMSQQMPMQQVPAIPIDAAVRIGKLKLITSRMPDTYSRPAVLKWAEKYEKLFADTSM